MTPGERFASLHREVSAYVRRALGPSLGEIHAARDVVVSPDRSRIAFTATILPALDVPAVTRVAIVAVSDGSCVTLPGSGNDRLPRWSPDGATLAFLSDRGSPGRDRLYLVDAALRGPVVAAPEIAGIVENVAWSPDGRSLAIESTSFGADRAGADGSGTHVGADVAAPSAPTVERSLADSWRRLWIWETSGAAIARVGDDAFAVWEAAFCGPDSVVAVVSDGAHEGAWYGARVERIDIRTGSRAVVYGSADDQVGLPRADPSGRSVAFVRACCSDRKIVAGELMIADLPSGNVAPIDTAGVDVTQHAWLDETTLFYVGIRGFETVAGRRHADGTTTTVWESRETCGSVYPDAFPIGDDAFACVVEAYDRFPAIAIVRDGGQRVVRDLAHDGSEYVRGRNGRMEETTWKGRDGLEIGGYVAIPTGPGPHPLVVLVHGGPVWAYRNTWSMSNAFTPLLVEHGYAVLHPNPRGSAGRGADFARRVRGDMGGEDAHDIARGVEALIRRGIADRARVAVTGRSYGGYMAAWLVTQTDLFAAAITMSPVTNYFSQHFTSNIPEFDERFLRDSPYNPTGRHHSRSPVFFASNATAPTLNIAGARDRSTPPTQAREFHRALLENGVTSELVIYPNAGHHIDDLDSQIDVCTRMLAWLDAFVRDRATDDRGPTSIPASTDASGR